MFKRIKRAFPLVLLAAGFFSMAVYLGALNGVTWLLPVTEAIGRTVDQLSLGVLGAAGVTLVGFWFFWMALKALFGRSKPKQ